MTESQGVSNPSRLWCPLALRCLYAVSVALSYAVLCVMLQVAWCTCSPMASSGHLISFLFIATANFVVATITTIIPSYAAVVLQTCSSAEPSHLPSDLSDPTAISGGEAALLSSSAARELWNCITEEARLTVEYWIPRIGVTTICTAMTASILFQGHARPRR